MNPYESPKTTEPTEPWSCPQSVLIFLMVLCMMAASVFAVAILDLTIRPDARKITPPIIIEHLNLAKSVAGLCFSIAAYFAVASYVDFADRFGDKVNKQ